MVKTRTNAGKSLTVEMAINLAAPHTWPAAIMPALIASCMATRVTPVSVTMVFTLLAIVILMQSSVNTFNDYYDYVKGADSAEDNVDPSDAVLVYNDINPKSALKLAIGFLVAAFILGIYAILKAGFTPLIIAAVGALFVVLYSAGKSPISYLPLGEVVSGVVMGGLIPLAVYQVLTGILDFTVLLLSIPTIIGVDMIMFTNNTCDIERDEPSGRRTLPILLGRDRARFLYRALVVLWIIDIVVNVAICFTQGLVIVPFALLASYPLVKALFSNPLDQTRRQQAMPQILSVNIVLGAFYAACILASTTTTLVF